ncbi:hypothetical protein CFSAN001627_11318 [Clostridium botulinum CFSAN001627]|uniref:Uncharacterized protein n=2 Tax=Clostridium botulinum TaxID=1491 RepID=M1ZXE4_CLOBO|nr:hypothetical protein CFSAN001627_11318 [Clostridium botulinum CFSAN001627]
MKIINTSYFQSNSLKIVQIDLYEAMKSCYIPKYKELMEEVSPNDHKFEDIIKRTKDFYIERML